MTYQELVVGAPLPRHRLLQTELTLAPSAWAASAKLHLYVTLHTTAIFKKNSQFFLYIYTHKYIYLYFYEIKNVWINGRFLVKCRCSPRNCLFVAVVVPSHLLEEKLLRS